jgi:hypothetical protein
MTTPKSVVGLTRAAAQPVQSTTACHVRTTGVLALLLTPLWCVLFRLLHMLYAVLQRVRHPSVFSTGCLAYEQPPPPGQRLLSSAELHALSAQWEKKPRHLAFVLRLEPSSAPGAICEQLATLLRCCAQLGIPYVSCYDRQGMLLRGGGVEVGDVVSVCVRGCVCARVRVG